MIRLAGVEDAAALDHFFGQLDRETRFMLHEAGERPSDIEGQRRRLAAMAAAPNQAMWLLELAGEVQGFAVLIGGGLARNRHCALVVMGLRSSARGLGWGERLLRTLIAAAGELGIPAVGAGGDGPQRGSPRPLSQVRLPGRGGAAAGLSAGRWLRGRDQHGAAAVARSAMTWLTWRGMRQSVRRLDEGRNALMKGILLRWLARYDAWCQEWGLVPENRRCCAPVRHDKDEVRPDKGDDDLTGSCGSRPR